MRNQAMERKLKSGDAIDVSKFPRTGDGDYILNDFVDGADYCDAQLEAWIWSIGRDNVDGVILASTGTKFYQNPAFTCLWLR